MMWLARGAFWSAWVMWTLRVWGLWWIGFPRGFRGRRVTCVVEGAYYNVRMIGLTRAGFRCKDSHYRVAPGVKVIPLTSCTWRWKDEGTTWCFGWDTARAKALVVAAALQEPAA